MYYWGNSSDDHTLLFFAKDNITYTHSRAKVSIGKMPARYVRSRVTFHQAYPSWLRCLHGSSQSHVLGQNSNFEMILPSSKKMLNFLGFKVLDEFETQPFVKLVHTISSRIALPSSCFHLLDLSKSKASSLPFLKRHKCRQVYCVFVCACNRHETRLSA